MSSHPDPHTHSHLGFIREASLQFAADAAAGFCFLPVVVAVAQRSNRDGEGLPRWIQRVLDHLRLVTDGEPGRGTRRHEEKEEKKEESEFASRTDMHHALTRFERVEVGFIHGFCIRAARQTTDWQIEFLFSANNPSEAAQRRKFI